MAATDYGFERATKASGELDDFPVADAGRANAQRLGRAPDERLNAAEVGIPTPLGDVVSVADPVSEDGRLAANVARTGHVIASKSERNDAT
jgi:hypothetical protein